MVADKSERASRRVRERSVDGSKVNGKQRAYDSSTRKRFESEARLTGKKRKNEKRNEKRKETEKKSSCGCGAIYDAKETGSEHGNGRREKKETGRKREVRDCKTCSSTSKSKGE